MTAKVTLAPTPQVDVSGATTLMTAAAFSLALSHPYLGAAMGHPSHPVRRPGHRRRRREVAPVLRPPGCGDVDGA